MTAPGIEEVAGAYYANLYRFALSLTQREADAADLTQQTFYLWAAKGHQLRDPSKVKAWLFTTMYREFLATRRLANRFPEAEPGLIEDRVACGADAAVIDSLDAAAVIEALLRLDDLHRLPLMLFYLDDRSYKEIADILGVPIGTVMSRLARARERLRGRSPIRVPMPSPQANGPTSLPPSPRVDPSHGPPDRKIDSASRKPG